MFPRFSQCAWPWLVVLVGLGLVSYSNSLTIPFTFDDLTGIVDNPTIRSFDARLLLHQRPLPYATFCLNYECGGLNPIGYHIFNVAIHLISGLALFGIVHKTLLLPAYALCWKGQANLLAFVVAAIWLVHPLNTESVTYIVQRIESLMGMLFFLCIYCLVRSANSESNRVRLWQIGTVAAFMASGACKEVAVTLPLVTLLFDRMFLTRTWRSVFQQRWAVYAAFIPGLLWQFHLISPVLLPFAYEPSSKQPPPAYVGFSMAHMTSWMYLRSQPAVILHYLRLSIWPATLRLDYLWPVESHPFRIYVLGSVILTLLFASVWLFYKNNFIGFLGLAFFMVLAPTSSFIPVDDLAFEHRMYVPLAAVIAILVFAIAILLQKKLASDGQWYVGFSTFAIVAIAALSARTIARNYEYHDPQLLWAQRANDASVQRYRMLATPELRALQWPAKRRSDKISAITGGDFSAKQRTSRDSLASSPPRPPRNWDFIPNNRKSLNNRHSLTDNRGT